MMLVGGSVVRVPQVAGYLAEKRNLHSLDGHCRPVRFGPARERFSAAASAPCCSSPGASRCRSRPHLCGHQRRPRRTTTVRPRAATPRRVWASSRRRWLMRWSLAGVSADSIGYVECHSTGTIVGDPLELEALTMAFRQGNRTQAILCDRLGKGQYRPSGAGGGNCRHHQDRARAASQTNPAEHQLSKRRILRSTSRRRPFT